MLAAILIGERVSEGEVDLGVWVVRGSGVVPNLDVKTILLGVLP